MWGMGTAMVMMRRVRAGVRAGRSARVVLVLAAGMLATSVMPIAATGSAAAPVTATPCTSPSSGAPIFVTATCVDPEYNQPYTDIDQLQTTTDPATNVTVSYRYVHGGFTGTTARFSLYFPAATQYRGRFFQSTYPTVTQEDASPGEIAFAVSNGAYVVSTNNGGIGGYRVNAAAAKYSQVVASQVYRTSVPARGYLYGASGGAYQTLSAVENSTGVWQGSVPMVPGVPNSIPTNQVVQLMGLRVLGDKLPQIADAMEPGGSGNPYAGLTPVQVTALQEATRLGFPLRGWWQYATLSGGAFDAVQGALPAFDPTYVSDFWSQPGYAGSEPAVQAARVQYNTTVTGLVGTPTSQVVVSSVPAGDLMNADLVFTSGAAAGQSVLLDTVSGNTANIASGATLPAGVKPGDQVRIDNSAVLAYEYYYRYQVPTPDEYAWNQFRGPNGTPIYPQRPLVGPTFTQLAGGSIPNGHFNGKMIMLASTMDVQAFPWSADWYHQQAQAAMGASLDVSYRLWYMDNADHDPQGPAATTAANAAAHIVPYTGEMYQALLDLDAWVANGTPPPATTNYTVDSNTQVQLAPTAAQRMGVQPVVDLTANGGATANVTVGQPVTFAATAQAPPNAGPIVSAQWDFQGAGTFPVQAQIGAPTVSTSLQATYTYSQPGTYFPAIRVSSEQSGNAQAPYTQIQNLGRARVVVHGQGYRLVASDGGSFNFGSVPFGGSLGNTALPAPIVATVADPASTGYWMAGADGSVYSLGGAPNFGSLAGIHLNKPIVGMAATPDGQGYWLVASDGGVFDFGDAAFYGSTGNIHLNMPIVGMAATPDGQGYWLVASDGGIFQMGDAAFYGSTGNVHLNKPVVGMTPTPDGQGYWLVASDGGIFQFGDAGFYGSTGNIHLNQPIVGMTATPDGHGYWLVAADGGIFQMGDAAFYGSTGGVKLNQPIVGMTGP